MSLVATIFVVFILGLILSIVGFVLRIISTTRKLYMHSLRYLFALFPPCALGEGLRNLASITLWSAYEGRGANPYHAHNWKITGAPLAFMAWETVAFMVSLSVISYSIIHYHIIHIYIIIHIYLYIIHIYIYICT